MAVDNNTKFRPPIVTIMGHIDHGKTTLLDKIRSTSVAKKESGGITQHIGSYQISVKQKDNTEKLITFIDTPGHAAFCDMRILSSQITDLIVLVVAANDGIMTQTKECISHIKKYNIPFIVALNKIDLENINIDKIKGQLVENDIIPEDYGGQISIIPLSAKTGQGIDNLLEMILLNAEILELKSESMAPLEAIVIESRLDQRRGPVTSLIIKKGTLNTGDIVYANNTYGKAKSLTNYQGQIINEALPGDPVEFLGFQEVPAVGSVVTPNKVIIEKINNQPKIELKNSNQEETPKLYIIVKADTQGTLKAILSSLSDDVTIVSSSVGPVTDNDVFLAADTKSQIFAFNVSSPKFIYNLAENQKVKIFESKVIYEIIEELEKKVLRLLEPTIDETILGEAQIIAEFNMNRHHIAGIRCSKGEIKKGDKIHLKREDKIIKDTKVENIQQSKQTVDIAKAGNEYGLTFRPEVDFKINDAIIAYKS